MPQGDSWAFWFMFGVILTLLPYNFGFKGAAAFLVMFLAANMLLQVISGAIRHLQAKWQGEIPVALLAVRKDGSVWLRSHGPKYGLVHVAYVTDQEGRNYDFRFVDPASATIPEPELAD